MKIVSAKELKNNTGKILHYIKMDETAVVTSHGKKIAVIMPAKEDKNIFTRARPFEEAWKDIENTIAGTSPAHKTWRETEDYSRGTK